MPSVGIVQKKQMARTVRRSGTLRRNGGRQAATRTACLLSVVVAGAVMLASAVV